MNATTSRLRLSTLDGFASALLIALGAAPLVGCGGGVEVEDGSGGSGGSGNTGAAGTTGGPGSTTGSNTTGSNTTGSNTTGSNTTTGGNTSTGSAAEGTTVGPGSTGASTGSGGGSGGCENPTPVIIEGVDTGFDSCGGGNYRRREALRCPESTLEPDTCCEPECEEGYFCSSSGEVACGCIPLCHTDDDCDPGSLCMCTPGGGQCVPATCATGSDCTAGEECTSWDTTSGCLYHAFACTTPADTCGGDADCADLGQYCVVQEDGHRQCQEGGCNIGRPFLIDETARTAGLAQRSDWCDRATHPALLDVDAALRARLGAAWEHIALMEHASIAAFARFAMQLLSLGAPPELLVRTHEAMRDETKHARLAFALASSYRGAPVGPGRLAIDGAIGGDVDVASFVKLTIREGCVGETVAALEAGEGEAAAINPQVREVLGTIAVDERAHAELAWSAVRWALEAFGDEAHAAVASEIAAASAELALGSDIVTSDEDREMARDGVTTSIARAALRRETLRKVVLPCLLALVAPRAVQPAMVARDAVTV